MKDILTSTVGPSVGVSVVVVLGGLWLFSGFGCRRPSSNRETSPLGNVGMGEVKALPAPDINGQPFLQTLRQRRTSHDFATRPLAPQMVANLLWAAYGENRPDGRRTAPSAHNWQYIDVYLADDSGLYQYDAKKGALLLIKSEDLRKKTGIQDYVTVAPMSLIYVNNGRKYPAGLPNEKKLLYGATTAGAIAQNVYLLCAANNLRTGVRADIERDMLHQAMGLLPEQSILLAQSIGYPNESK